jgi:hypothetical protein
MRVDLQILLPSIVSKVRVSEIGCPAVRDICLIAADKYLPHVSCPPGNHETTKYTPNDLLLLLFIKDLLVMGSSIFGGQVKFEFLVVQGQPHHFWISETLKVHYFIFQIKKYFF